MKIAVWHNLPRGGGKRALYDQVRGLVARGHEVESWCPPTADQHHLPLNSLVPEHIVPLHLTFEPAANFLMKCRPLHWNASLRLRAMNEHCRKCAGQIDAGEFDLLFAAPTVGFHTPPIGRFVKSIPRILYLQEPCRELYECQPNLPWTTQSWRLKDWLDIELCRRTLHRRFMLPQIRIQAGEERRSAMAFDEIFVNSYFSRESVWRAYGIDSKVCYLGVDTDKFVNRNQAREPVAVSIGGLWARKNPELIVRALSKVSEARRPKLVWIADSVDSGYLDRMKQMAEKNQVHFELRYRIDDSELIDILNRARMMLYAPRLEPFGYAPLEANACGVPVIAIAEGGLRETIEHGANGLVVEHDPESMAAAIECLMVDDELAQRLSKEAHCLVRERWALPGSIDRLESRLKSALTRAREEVAESLMDRAKPLPGERSTNSDDAS